MLCKIYLKVLYFPRPYLNDCGHLYDHLDKTGLLQVFFLFKSRHSATTTSSAALKSKFQESDVKQTNKMPQTYLGQLHVIQYNINMVIILLICSQYKGSLLACSRDMSKKHVEVFFLSRFGLLLVAFFIKSGSAFSRTLTSLGSS